MWDDVEIVTIDMAVQHGRVDTDELEDLKVKLRQAHDLVLNHVHRDDDDWVDEMEAWTVETVPKDIQAAVMCQFLELVRFRGDDDPSKVSPLALSPYVTRLLLRYHDPALA